MTVLLSEEDTKTQRITPALQKAAMEYNLKADRFRIVPDQNKTYKESSRPRADYVLFHNTNVPFAYACAGDTFVEYNLKARQQRTISLIAVPSPA